MVTLTALRPTGLSAGRALLVTVSVLVLGVTGLSAAGGRIPVYGPTTISQSGSYYLTRDIALVSGDSPITINAADVTLDLNGHTISISPPGGEPLTTVSVTAPAARVRIENGTIVGTDYVMQIVASDTVFLSRLTLRSSYYNGVSITAPHAVVEGCSISASDWALSFTCSSGCEARENTIFGGSRGIQGSGGGPFIVSENAIKSGLFGIDLTMTGGMVRGNRVQGDSTAIVVTGASNGILDNTVSAGNTGINVSGNANEISRNTVGATTYGVNLASGSLNNTIDRNHIARSVYGLNIPSGATGNVYSNNRAQGCGTPYSVVAGNTNAGGNY